MNEIVSKAVEDYQNAELAYAKFTTPNNVGATGSHETGWLISKSAWPLFFDKPGVKGEQIDRLVEIKWQNNFTTQSRFVYYGQKTRNEYRLTRFGRGFPFLQEENIGDYILILRMSKDEYKAYVFQTDNDIEDFTSAVGISVTETNSLLQPHNQKVEEPSLTSLIEATAAETKGIMPTGLWIASKAFEINITAKNFHANMAIESPDIFLLSVIKTEYELFQAIERLKFGPIIQAGFASVDTFISVAHSILNSRKSRAGYSLENHLATIFNANELKHERQVITEGNKTADFIFPDGTAYHNPAFLIENLFFMAAKTTCKDRWRQVLNEADRLDTIYLMTLQQGISKNQCKEMQDEGVILVVPDDYKFSFPKEFHDDILSLHQFITTVKATQS
jgi:type II restriction enzyme